MHITGMEKPLRHYLGTLALLAWAVSTCQADPIATPPITYSTSGTVDPTGIVGTPAVSFKGVDNGSLTPGSPFDLGQLIVTTPASGAITSYAETPFHIVFQIDTIDGSTPNLNETPVVISGRLSGTVGPGQLAEASFSPYEVPVVGLPLTPTPIVFQTGNQIYSLNISGLTEFPLESSAAGAPTTVQGELDYLPINIPEPASFAVFLVAATGLCLHRCQVRSQTK